MKYLIIFGILLAIIVISYYYYKTKKAEIDASSFNSILQSNQSQLGQIESHGALSGFAQLENSILGGIKGLFGGSNVTQLASLATAF